MRNLLVLNDPIPVPKVKSVSAIIEPNADKTHRFITTRRFPIYYMPITKCGSTFMKNLMYVLDHDELHPNASRIHDYPGDLRRADTTPAWMIRRSKSAFSILRNPVSRFLSLYFDKIYGTGPQNFPQLRLEIAEDCDLDLSPNLTAKQHQVNCRKLIGWIDNNLSGETDIEINPHWRPQSVRANAVRHLKVGFLTTDGLDQQLPNYLGHIIPNLSDKIAKASVRNQTLYPVSIDEVTNSDLEAEINRVYEQDLANYTRVSKYWRKRLASPALSASKSSDRITVLSTHRFNINVIAMQKAGCTFVRNLFYTLDHGRVHPEPANIASDECLAFRNKTSEDLKGAANIIVLRDPVSRFFSLYFDKVWGDGQQAFPWISKKLIADRKFRLSRDLSTAEHHDNCCRFLGYLESRFNERPPEDLNPHWRPQYVKADQARKFGFTPILLEDFVQQFTHVTLGKIRGLELALSQPLFKNETEKPIPPSELISPWIEERIQALYSQDIALYETVRSGWLNSGEPPDL